MRDILRADDPQIVAALDVIEATAPDILLLTDIDIDAGGATLSALAEALKERGASYPFWFAAPGNAGLATGIDLDGDGRRGTPRDAQGFGRFRGDGAMALLSRFPLTKPPGGDFTGLLWKDLPEARLPVHSDGAPFPTPEARQTQRLSSVGHWILRATLPGGESLTLMAYAATPPVFDGPEDRNGLRGGDETALWQRVLEGRLGPPVDPPFLILGRANVDPVDGDGRHDTMLALLTHPSVQDPAPTSEGGADSADATHRGPPATDTAEWRPAAEGGPGNLRVDYVLPSRDLRVLGAGVHWPAGDAQTERNASRHRLVWVDVALPLPLPLPP